MTVTLSAHGCAVRFHLRQLPDWDPSAADGTAHVVIVTEKAKPKADKDVPRRFAQDRGASTDGRVAVALCRLCDRCPCLAAPVALLRL